VVDSENFRVTKGGEEVSLTPRAFDVLRVLLARAGKVLEKQVIFDTVWKETFVTDQALTKIIKELRHALGDPAREPRYIETIPKRGYRFIADVGVSDREEPRVVSGEALDIDGHLAVANTSVNRKRYSWVISAAVTLTALTVLTAWYLRQDTSTVTGKPRTIAVLPFKPIDAESRNESLEVGMAETLITRLSSAHEIAVRPITSVNDHAATGQDPIAYGKRIGVDSVLDGSIQKVGDRVRITARLIDVSSERPLWSDHFDERFTDIFKVQDSIAERVADALTLRLSQDEQQQLSKHYTDDPDAYQLYLNAQLVWNGRRQNWIEQSLAFYTHAVEKDPNFALAYIGMADCYIMLNGHHQATAADTVEKAKPLIFKALEIDDSLAQAHNALAEFKYQYEYDWAGSEAEFKKAIELNPNLAWIRQAYGWYLMSLARFEEASVQMELAYQLDPTSLTINAGRGRLLYYSRQYDKAIEHFKNMIAVEPQDSSLYAALYQTYVVAGRYDDAIDTHVVEMKLNGETDDAINKVRQMYQQSGWQGFLEMQLAALTRSARNNNIDAMNFAILYMRLGRYEDAMTSLKRAVDARETPIVQLKIDPVFDPVRNDSRFAELLSSIGLELKTAIICYAVGMYD